MHDTPQGVAGAIYGLVMDAAERRAKWQIYEQVAGDLLERLSQALELGFVKVAKKQKFMRTTSGTTWEIDRVGVAENGQKVVAIECRRYTKSKLSQNAIAALAYIIRDVGAARGIVVTPNGVQPGGEKIAKREKIIIIRLDKDATTTDFMLRTMDKLILGAGFSGHGVLSVTAVGYEGTAPTTGQSSL